MGMRRALAGAVLGLAGSMLLALPAAAVVEDPYGPVPTAGPIGVSATTVAPGGAVALSGGGFAPGATITITITVVNGFGRIELNPGPAPMGTLLAAGTTRGAVQGFAAAQTVSANSSGVFSASVKLTQPGTNVITASGLDPNGNLRTLTTRVFVTGGGAGNGGTGNGSDSGSGVGTGALPNTGADLKLPIILGGALVLLGSGAIVAGRRRKQHADAAA
jgi:LPXTG-motif cell wall-anchored protein